MSGKLCPAPTTVADTHCKRGRTGTGVSVHGSMGIGVWQYGYQCTAVWVLVYGSMGISVWQYGYRCMTVMERTYETCVGTEAFWQ